MSDNFYITGTLPLPAWIKSSTLLYGHENEDAYRIVFLNGHSCIAEFGERIHKPLGKQTHFDQITESPEELAKFIVNASYLCVVCVYTGSEKECLDHACCEGIAEYLKQESEE